jgi:hypothetical protein
LLPCGCIGEKSSWIEWGAEEKLVFNAKTTSYPKWKNWKKVKWPLSFLAFKFLHNVFVFCVYNVCCCMSEDSAFEKLQRIVRGKKCKKLQKWENAKTWRKEYVAKVSTRQQKM